MQRINYSNDNVAFENPKTNVIILRTNLHIKHFIAIVLNTHEHIPLCRDQKCVKDCRQGRQGILYIIFSIKLHK